MQTREKIQGKINLLRYANKKEQREIDEGRRTHGMLRYAERNISGRRKTIALLEWVLED